MVYNAGFRQKIEDELAEIRKNPEHQRYVLGDLIRQIAFEWSSVIDKEIADKNLDTGDFGEWAVDLQNKIVNFIADTKGV